MPTKTMVFAVNYVAEALLLQSPIANCMAYRPNAKASGYSCKHASNDKSDTGKFEAIFATYTFVSIRVHSWLKTK